MISKFVVLHKLFRQPTYVKQNIIGDSWEGVLWSFRVTVLVLYEESYEYLEESLNSGEKEFFKSICFNKASKDHWGDSLQQLSYFLAQKSGQRVMVFIDEYEVPVNRAYEFGFFVEVHLCILPDYDQG